jgi:hypothetical protein
MKPLKYKVELQKTYAFLREAYIDIETRFKRAIVGLLATIQDIIASRRRFTLVSLEVVVERLIVANKRLIVEFSCNDEETYKLINLAILTTQNAFRLGA